MLEDAVQALAADDLVSSCALPVGRIEEALVEPLMIPLGAVVGNALVNCAVDKATG